MTCGCQDGECTAHGQEEIARLKAQLSPPFLKENPMNERDFCFWLQGFFEIGCAGTTPGGKLLIRGEQLKCINTHLCMVEAYTENKTTGLCAWLRGFLDAQSPGFHNMEHEQAEIMRRRLAAEFLHVIDPHLRR